MKIYSLIILIAVMLFSVVEAADLNSTSKDRHKHFLECYDIDDVDYSEKDGTVIFSRYNGSYSKVAITESGKLFIDDQEIGLNQDEKKLLKEFSRKFRELMVSVEKLELKAKKLGRIGTETGLNAALNVLSRLESEEDLEEIEDEINKKVEQIEEEAEEIEEEAEKIEESAEELDDLHDEIVERIPALRELDWY
ncbi:MAG: hypothetical protein EH225_03200 [Calditrichaeota bacterium]|nr:hypothetical protein [Calditrichota bacterium]RQW06499.1 MAG: hypothetical protein EH225_03200 [Calditrichota bacterium]